VEKAVAVVVGKAPPPVGVGGGEKGGCSSIRPTGLVTVEAGEKVVDEMVDEVATPAEPEAMAAVAAVRAVGVTEAEMEAERTEPVVAADRVPAMVVVVAIGRSLGR
jgi:hypothetical protein